MGWGSILEGTQRSTISTTAAIVRTMTGRRMPRRRVLQHRAWRHDMLILSAVVSLSLWGESNRSPVNSPHKEPVMFVSCNAICMLRNMLITLTIQFSLDSFDSAIKSIFQIMLIWRTKFGVNFVYSERWTPWNANNQSTVVSIHIKDIYNIHVHYQWTYTLQLFRSCFRNNPKKYILNRKGCHTSQGLTTH